MTKFKEYLRAKNTNPDYDPTAPYTLDYFEINTCAGVETDVETRIMDSCVVVIVYSNIADPEYAVYDRYGEHGWFNTCGDMSCIERFNCDPEFTFWMCDTSYKISATLFTVAVGMYENDEKVRIAFKHMRAGIMDEQVFYKWLVKQYPKHITSV